MYFENIRLKNFRNHADTSLNFGTKANVVLGGNGEGKTNLLEAISYISLTKSFYASSDTVVLKINEQVFEIEANVVSDGGMINKVHIGYDSRSGEKAYSINKRRIEPFSSIIGKFPLVFLSPENADITFGGPTDRRKFLDIVISQSNISYFKDLSEYRKVVRHRNKIFGDAKNFRTDTSVLLEPWNNQLVKYGSRIMFKRKLFVNEFRKYIEESYSDLVDVKEIPSIAYEPSFEINDDDAVERISEKFFDVIKQKNQEELKFGTTLIGPHRDEIGLKLNGLDLRKFASQGQHKTFLIALKIGEFFYLKERCKETPVFLLDDVFSELDANRALHMLKLIESLSQTFLTSTKPEIFDVALNFGDTNKKFFVKSGRVETTQN
jgi:DNA replication and repair protein RecF